MGNLKNHPRLVRNLRRRLTISLKKLSRPIDPIAEYGDHNQLVNLKGGIYAEMFQAQAKYYAV
jgi:hypothetical protein